MGLALLAGYAAGIIKDLDDAAQHWTKTGRRTTPNPQKNEFYRERLNRYRAYIRAINEVNEYVQNSGIKSEGIEDGNKRI
jgi:ribulose kinase